MRTNEPTPPGATPPRTALPGRGGALRALGATAEAISQRGASFFLVEATAGLGKTRLIEAALGGLDASTVRTIWAASEHGQEPYKTAARLVDAAVGNSWSAFEAPRSLVGVAVDQARSDRLRAHAELAQRLLDSCHE